MGYLRLEKTYGDFEWDIEVDDKWIGRLVMIAGNVNVYWSFEAGAMVKMHFSTECTAHLWERKDMLLLSVQSNWIEYVYKIKAWDT